MAGLFFFPVSIVSGLELEIALLELAVDFLR